MNTSTLPAVPARLSTARLLIWGGFALVLFVAPLLFTSNLSITMLAQMGIAIIACLSYTSCWGRAAC